MKEKHPTHQQSGFTVLEVLIAVCAASIIFGGIYMAYSSQQKTYLASDATAEMQQNIRSALFTMGREIREAGCDPSRSANAGFVTATIGRVQFTRDIAGNAISPNQSDGDTLDANENVIFGFADADDTDGNGIVDGGGADWRTVADLGRDTGGGFQPIAERVAAIEFNYILDDDTTTTAPSAGELSRIKAVQISLMTIAPSPGKTTNSVSYVTGSGAVWGPFNDLYRRRFVSTTIECRNMGI